MPSTALTTLFQKTQVTATTLGQSLSFAAASGSASVAVAAHTVVQNVDAWRASGSPLDTKTLMAAARSAQGLILPAQTALKAVKQNATQALVDLLPEPLAEEGARKTVQNGVQWGAKVGGFFGPIGTVVGVSLGAAATIGMRYFFYEPEKATAVEVTEEVAVIEVSGLPPLERAATI